MNNNIVNREPVGLLGAINTALLTTLGVLGLLLDWSTELVSALALVIGAWIGVASYFVRNRVTPTPADQPPRTH